MSDERNTKARPLLIRRYTNILALYRKYWDAYGGWKEIAVSPYFHASALLALLSGWKLATTEDPWFGYVLDVTPSMLGFTLSGYAFLIGVGSERFREAMRGPEPDGSPSPFISLNASFVHFIAMQFLALVYAVLGKVFCLTDIFTSCLGLLIFYYSLFLSLATVFAIFWAAWEYDRSPKEEDNEGDAV